MRQGAQGTRVPEALPLACDSPATRGPAGRDG